MRQDGDGPGAGLSALAPAGRTAPPCGRVVEGSGALDRALPEVAAALRRRRDDPFLVDPASAYRLAAAAPWRVVEGTGGTTRRGRM